MLMAVIAVLGVLFSIWALVGDVARVEIKSLAHLHRVWLQIWTGLALAFVLLVPFVEAAIFHRAPPTEAGKALTLALESLLLAGITAASLWPLRSAVLPGGGPKWDLDLVEAANGRIQELVRQGKASTAAAVVARFAPMVDRAESEAGERDAYVKVLDWCLRHEAFVGAMVREQTETVAKVLKAGGWLMREHAGPLLHEAFAGDSRVLVTEISRCTVKREDNLGYVIPADCVLLHVLIEEPALAEELDVCESIAAATFEELEDRRMKASPFDDDLRPTHEDDKPRQWSIVAAAIHYCDMTTYEALRKNTAANIGIGCYSSFTTWILRILEEDDPVGNGMYATHYHKYVAQMLDNLDALMMSAVRLDSDVEQVLDDGPFFCMGNTVPEQIARAYGSILARLCFDDVQAENLVLHCLETFADRFRRCRTNDLPLFVAAIKSRFSTEVFGEHARHVLPVVERMAASEYAHEGTRELLSLLESNFSKDW